jgi:hypothetical protein
MHAGGPLRQAFSHWAHAHGRALGASMRVHHVHRDGDGHSRVRGRSLEGLSRCAHSPAPAGRSVTQRSRTYSQDRGPLKRNGPRHGCPCPGRLAGEHPKLSVDFVLFTVLGGASALKLGLWLYCRLLKRNLIMLALSEDHLNDVSAGSRATHQPLSSSQLAP